MNGRSCSFVDLTQETGQASSGEVVVLICEMMSRSSSGAMSLNAFQGWMVEVVLHGIGIRSTVVIDWLCLALRKSAISWGSRVWF